MDTQETRIYTAIIITAIVLGVIITYFIGSIIVQQRRNLALQKQLMLSEIATLEQERTRTAADLHDDLGPLLSAIRFRVDHARGDDPDLAIASSQLDDMIVRIREIANDLMPAALQRKGLVTAVTEYVDNIRQTTRLKLDLESPASIPLEPHKQIHIYRVIQEVVHNCLKHADATEMTIRLQVRDNNLLILCRDNGKGFDPLQSNGKGIGLKSLRNRTEIMGGKMMQESKPGNGAAILLEIPL
ncbi:MAG TPA: ATP-binding protein [Chitinophagaceae bacterium]|nr:ATP-binding protein [Chitinophagaceae bacterium]